jgi:hypothetical protein
VKESSEITTLRHDVCAQVLTRDLLFQIPLIADTKIALIGRCEGQVGSFDHIIGRDQNFRDFRIQEGEGTGNGQTVNGRRRPGEVTFNALDLGIRRIVGEEQVGTIDGSKIVVCRPSISTKNADPLKRRELSKSSVFQPIS